MTREQLFTVMINKTPIYVNGIRCIVVGIEMEDGSGYSFNLKLMGCSNMGYMTVHYRCLNPTSFVITTK